MKDKIQFTMIESFEAFVPEDDIIASATPEIKAENRRMHITGYCILIKHPELGNILYDTGVINDWQESWHSRMKEWYTITSSNDLAQKLEEIKLTPADIDIVIASHLHYDHGGNIVMFQNTKAGKNIIISGAEAREAFVAVNLDDTGYSNTYGSYWKHEFLNLEGIGYRLIEGDTKLGEGVELFIQSGHTPGVIGMVLHTDAGIYIFTSDAIYSSRNYGPPAVLPGLCYDPEGFLENVERVRKMKEKYNATVVFGHDVADLKHWKKSPYFYG